MTAEQIAEVVMTAVKFATAPLVDEIAALKVKALVVPDLESSLKSSIASLREELLVTKSQVVSLDAVTKIVVDEVAAYPLPRDGKDADLTVVAALQKQIAFLQDQFSKAPDLIDVEEVVTAKVAEAIAAMPKPVDGKDGISVDPVAVEAMVSQQVEKAVAAIPAPKDGQSVTLDDVQPLIVAEVQKSVAAIHVPKDGIGIKTAMVDRTGDLLVTFTDGTEKNVGSVVGEPGRPGLPGVPGQRGEKGEDGTIGIDGLGFDDIAIEHDGERSFTFNFKRGDRVKQIGAFTIPSEIYRGVYIDGKTYDRGDGVTWAGSEWNCNETTSTKPGDGSKAWTLKVKRGRDGKDGRVIEPSGFPVVTVGKR